MMPATFLVTTTADSGAGSLRQAILDADAAPAGPLTIDFQIPTSDPNFVDDDAALSGGDAAPDVFVISPLSALPALNNPNAGIAIDGGSQTAFTGDTNPFGPEVVLDGTSAGTASGLLLQSSRNEVHGLDIRGFNGDGILVTADDNWIAGNDLGTDATGTVALGNTDYGVQVLGVASNVIGTDGDGNNDAAEGNVISGNGAGIQLGNTAHQNIVAGNLIGTNAAGTAALANQNNPGMGIWLVSGANHNRIGTDGNGVSDALERNVISGNGTYGVEIGDVGTTGNVVAGNRIGTDAAGTAAIPNAQVGVFIRRGATANIVGTNGDGQGDASEGNIISGNASSGVVISDTGSSGNVVAGNRIGTDATGSAAVANGTGVVVLGGATSNVIGTDGDGVGDAAERNVVSGNVQHGVEITGAGTDHNVVAGNFVGLNATGTAALANSWSGVAIDGGAKSNRIGASGGDPDPAGEGNVVSGNTLVGVWITDPGTSLNTVAGNFIGTDPTGTAAIANDWEGVAIGGGASQNLIGTDGDGLGDAAERNFISGNLLGGISIGRVFSGPGTDNNRIAGNYIGTNTAGSAALGNVSNGILIQSGARGNFIGTDGDGQGDAVEGNLISGNSGHGVEITGAGTNGNIVAGNFIGSGVSGTTALGNGLAGIAILSGAQSNRIGTNSDGVSDAAERNIISANASDAYAGVDVDSSSNNLVAGNYIGTDVTGNVALGNAGDGISLPNAANNTIGGTAAGAGNVISANGRVGVWTFGVSASGNRILGNLIGTNAAGTAALGNGLTTSLPGVMLDHAPNNFVGGAAPGSRNVISGSGSNAVLITGSQATGNRIQGNYLGTNASGSGSLGNKAQGVLVNAGASQNWIGTDGDGVGDAAEGNLISGNTLVGVYITDPGTTGNVVAGNLIGTDASGAVALANGGAAGVRITGGAHGNRVGTNGNGVSDALERNVISGNTGRGVEIDGAGTNQNLVARNLIGTDIGGTTAIGNASGVDIESGATGNTIGGAGTGAGNLVSGNSQAGVILSGPGNLVAGNKVGTNAAGTSAVPNAGDGIDIFANANTIGGTASAAGNIVSGNAYTGIEIVAATGTLVAGNRIGTNAAGTAGIGNAGDGIALIGASGNTIGGTASGARNVISKNALNGIHLYHQSDQNLILGNDIGTDATGTVALGNAVEGLAVDSGSHNTIGGTASGAGNVISGNAGDGVLLAGSGSGLGSSRFVSFLGDTNPGRFSYGSVSSDTQLSYEMFTAYTDTDLYIGFRVSDNIIVADPNVSILANDEMELFIGGNRNDSSFTLPNRTGDKGAFQLLADLAGHTAVTGAGISGSDWSVQSGLIPGGYVMQFDIPLSLINTVNAPGYSPAGPGSLLRFEVGASDNDTSNVFQQRYGVLWRNDPDFSPYTAGESSWVVDLFLDNGQPSGSTAPLLVTAPHMTSAPQFGALLGGDGTTTGNVVQGNKIGTNAAGSAALANGGDGVLIQSGAAANTIGGTVAGARNIISGNTTNGVDITGSGTSGNIVAGNRIGTDVTGSSALANFQGVAILDGASSNIIGTDGDGVGDAAEGDLISGNTYVGVFIANPGTDSNVLAGNLIGTNAAGTAAIPNGTTTGGGTILTDQAAFNRVGTDADGVSDALERNVISGNLGWMGLMVEDVHDNVVAGNYIGTNATGSAALPNAGNGMDIKAGSQHNRVGTDGDGVNDAAERNVISGNVNAGIIIWNNWNTGTSFNIIAGNFIGTDATGTAPLGNGFAGINIFNGAQSNIIGSDGTNPDQRNLISANSGYGVIITDSGTSSNVVAGNFIGLNAAGTSALGNGHAGVLLTGGTTANTIGGLTVAARNVIGGNGNRGVFISTAANSTAPTTGNVIEGNYIGTDASGMVPMSNHLNDAVSINLSPGNTIGGTVAGAGNVLDGGQDSGVFIYGDDQRGPFADAAGTLIAGNIIGLAADGITAGPGFGAGNSGVTIDSAPGTTVGGTVAAARNIISNNARAGILIANFEEPDGAYGTVVQGNFIGTDISGTLARANAIGVDIEGASSSLIGTDGDGVGDAAEGNLISGNTAAGVVINAASAIIDGGNTLQGASDNVVAGNRIGTTADGSAPLGNGLGVQLVGGASNTTIGGTAAGAGNVISGSSGDGVQMSGATTTANLVQGNLIGTDATGEAPIGNSGSGVLILGASGNTVGGSVGGARNVLSGNGTGVTIIGPVTGALVAGNLIGTDASGTTPVGNLTGGVVISDSSGVTIGGTGALARNVISGNQGDGVFVEGASTGTTLEGNYVGIDQTGTQALGNAGSGIEVDISPDTTIGGTAVGAGNVISANTQAGVSMQGNATFGAAILGNFIGTDKTARAALGNATYGVALSGMSAVTIGGTAAGARNIISANAGAGVALLANDSGDLVQGNLIGTDLLGSNPMGNGIGVLIDVGSADNTIGGTAAGAGNTIAFSTGAGVDVAAAAGAGNLIRLNAIFSDAGLGIDLGSDGVTLNDSVPHTGPNDHQDFPVITGVTSAGGTTTVTGTLHGTPTTTFTLDFYTLSSINPSGYGEGHDVLGSSPLTTDASGNAGFSLAFPTPSQGAKFLAATATDPGGNTSEFSREFGTNLPPTAVVGFATRTVNQGTAIAFDGRGSTDPDGDPLTFSWTFGDGGTANGPAPRHTFELVGTDTVTLTVDDGFGGTSTATATIAVNNVPPTFLPASTTTPWTFATPSPGDGFGAAIAAVDGNAAITARFDDGQSSTSHPGAVYLYDGVPTDDGVSSTYVYGALMRVFDDPNPAAGDEFGASIAAVGNDLLIGAPGGSTTGPGDGAAYLFDADPDSLTFGALLATFTLPDPDATHQARFGSAVSSAGTSILSAHRARARARARSMSSRAIRPSLRSATCCGPSPTRTPSPAPISARPWPGWGPA